MARDIFTNFRIIPRESDFLNRKIGSRGEIFFDQNTNTLRLYNGVQLGGFSLAKNDLSNVSNASFLAKAQSAGFSGGVQAGVAGRLAFYPSDGSQVNDLPEVYWESDSSNRLMISGTVVADGEKSFLRFYWDTLAELNDDAPASLWHGMIAHVHETGRLYFAHGGSWNALANYDEIGGSQNSFTTIHVTGQTDVVAESSSDTLNFVAGSNITITTNPTTDSIIIASSSGNGFGTFSIAGQDDIVADQSNDTITLAAGTGISITTNNTTDTITITATTAITSINDLSDVDTASTPPTSGQVLKWNGTQWAPAADVASGGAGLDADTLDGFDSAYYLNYNNLSNRPTLPDGIFKTISVAGQSNVIADSITDTLTLVAGTGITLTTNSITDTITITNQFSDTNYSISSETGVGGTLLRLSGTDSSTDDVLFANGTGITVTRTDANTITIASTVSAGATTLDGLSDVVITSPTTNQVLKYNGVNWINDTDSTSAGSASNSFETIAVSGQNSVVADSSTDTLTLVAGTGISITTNNTTDTITITNSQTLITTFELLSDATTAGLTIDEIYLPAITRLDVTNSGATAYRFDQYGSTNNPTIYAVSGMTIAFKLNVTGHPFLIQDGLGANYSTGLVHVSTTGTVSTGSSAQGQTSGTLYWKVPDGISGGYRYQCSIHAPMVGSISVKAFVSI